MNSPTAAVRKPAGPTAEALISNIRLEALELYCKHRYWCSEAVLVALNRGLAGGLTDTQAMAMAAPFSRAMGESGCMCGALSGAVMAIGLMLGQDRPYRLRKQMRRCARLMHDRFRAENGSTCCRVLSSKFKHDHKALVTHCAGLVARATSLAAQLVLEKQPGRLNQVHLNPSGRRPAKWVDVLRLVGHFFAS